MNLSTIPKDSLLQPWLVMGRFMESPNSYLVATALSCISALLRRRAFVTLGETGIIYPNLSIILIGPTGLGKDTALDMGQDRILSSFMPDHEVTGRTEEGIAWSLFDIHKRMQEQDTCGYMIAPEIKAFFGGKDYQQGMIEFLTHILSNKKAYRYATKNNPFSIPAPTVTLQCGSTEDWFHKLPSAALEGGFIPRSLVVVEDVAKSMIPLPEDLMDNEDRAAHREAIRELWSAIEAMEARFVKPEKMMIDSEAKDIYSNWYCNRYKYFGPFAQGYAHRSRQHILRLAMLMAASRQRTMIDVVDINFAIDFMMYLIEKLEREILPPTEE